MKTSTVQLTEAPAKKVSGKDAFVLAGTLVILIVSMVFAIRIGFEANILQHELKHTQEHLQEMKDGVKQMASSTGIKK